MLTSEYLFNMTDRIVEIYEELNNYAIEDICRRIAKTGGLTTTAEIQIKKLQESGYLLENIQKQVQKTLNKSNIEMKELFEESAEKSIKFDDNIYKKAGLKPVQLSRSPQMIELLTAGLNQTNGTLKNLAQSIAEASQKTYFNQLDKIYFQITTGQSDYISAITRATKETAQDGVNITYPSGARISIEAAVRRAALTGVNQTIGKVQIARAQELETDLVEVTSHANPRPEHFIWQGKIYSISGTSKKYKGLVEATQYGTVKGLKGANCRHDFYPFIEGISEPLGEKYNKEESEKAYSLSQKQRLGERNIRKTKRELNGLEVAAAATNDKQLKSALENKYNTSAVKLDRQRRKYESFCSRNKLKTQKERTQLADFGRKEAAKARAAARRENE